MEYKLRFNDDTARDSDAQIDYKLPREELDTEFKKEFPPDPVIGSELDDAAPVWKVYRKEANAYDSALLDGWSSTLDILLIFAGLFSAVATAFVIESYQQLQPDHTAYTAVALYILVSATNHSTGINLPPPPDLQYASSLARWINGLWFTSIMLSLIVALLSILVKQWIGEYRARNLASAKSPRDWAHRHELYSQALHACPVAELVSLLPVMLHLSLFLFFAGMIAFLWTLDVAIGILIIALGSLLAVFYLGCTLIPLWIPHCPTSTPLVHQVRRLVLSLGLLALHGFSAMLRLTFKVKDTIARLPFLIRQRLSKPAPTPPSEWPPSSRAMLTIDPGLPERTIIPSARSIAERALGQAIKLLAARRRDRSEIAVLTEKWKVMLSVSALRWLIFDVSDSDAVAVGIQSLGALHPSSAVARGLQRLPVNPFDIHNCFTRSAAGPSVSEAIRAQRSDNCMKKFRGTRGLRREIYTVLDTSRYPDALAISRGAFDLGGGEELVNHMLFSTLTSSIIRVMWAFDLEASDFLRLLALCNFQQFVSADWDIAIRSLPTTSSRRRRPSLRDADVTYGNDLASPAGITVFRRPLLFRVSRSEESESRPHALAQWVAETFETLDKVRDKRSATRVIYHLLPEYRIGGSLQRPLRQSPVTIPLSVLKILAMPTNDLKLNAEDLDAALCCLEGAVDHSQREETYWIALACILDSARFLQLPDTTHAPWQACMRGIEAWELRESPETAFTVLRSVFFPNRASGAHLSVWTMLRRTGLPFFGLRLTRSLAAVLRAHITGPSAASDNAAFTDLFFAKLDPRGVVAALVPVWLRRDQGKSISSDYQFSGDLVEVVRRCAVLRPEWWVAVREYARQSTSEHERDVVLAIEEELDQLSVAIEPVVRIVTIIPPEGSPIIQVVPVGLEGFEPPNT